MSLAQSVSKMRKIRDPGNINSNRSRKKESFFLEDSGGFNKDATVDNLLDLVKNSEHWKKAIFDIAPGSVYKYHVEAMFLQLIAAQLISAEIESGKLVWKVSRDKEKRNAFPPYRWKDTKNWDGIYLRDEGKERKYKIN